MPQNRNSPHTGSKWAQQYITTVGGGIELVASRVEDVDGNWIKYHLSPKVDGGYYVGFERRLLQIEASDGRIVDFNYDPSQRLSSFTFDGKIWGYEYSLTSQYPTLNYLKKVNLPEGLSWQFQNLGPNSSQLGGYAALSRITVPSGAVIDYTYQSCGLVPCLLLATRNVTGPNLPAGGLWTYSRTQTTATQNVTVLSPGRDERYSFYRAPDYATQTVPDPIRAGQMIFREVRDRATSALTRKWNFSYASVATFGTLESYGVWTFPHQRSVVVPIIRIITDYGQGTTNRTYTTSISGHNTYGQPASVTETGIASRVSRYTWLNNTATWLIGLPDTESIDGESGNIDRDYFATTGRLQQECRFGVCSSFTYHSTGDLWKKTWIKDGAQLQIEYLNYYRGQPRLENHPENVQLEREINATGTLQWSEDARNNRTHYTYDGLNRLKSVTPPIHSATTITYPDPRTMILTRGTKQKTTSLDGSWRTISEAEVDLGIGGFQTIYSRRTYDSSGRTAFRSVPSFNSNESVGLSYQYDSLDRKTIVTNTADGTNVTFCYKDNCSNPIGTVTNGELVTDERGYQTVRNYRSYGDPAARDLASVTSQVRKSTEPGGLKSILTTISRDRYGNVSSIVQAGKTRQFILDANKRLWKLIEPEFGTTEFTYDESGNRKSSKVGSSATTIYQYDGRNRIVLVNYPGTTPDVSYGYFPNDKVSYVQNSSARWDYDYNEMDQLLWEQLTVGAGVYQTTYAYDGNDALSTITYPGQSIVNLNPDALGRARQLGNHISSVTYHPGGEVSSMAFANGHTETLTLDSRRYPDRMQVSGGGATAVDQDYGIDASGNVTSIVDSVNILGNRTFRYDGMHRMTGADGSWGVGSLAYDDMGNITAKTLGSQGINYVYNATTGKLSSTSGTAVHSFSYDVYGNVIGNGLYNFSYNDASQLTSVPTLTGVSYQYDGNGRRAVATANGITQHYFYNQSGLLLFKTEVGGNKATEYFHLGTRLAASRDFGPGVSNSPPPAGSLQFSGSSAIVDEGAGSVVLTVTRAGGSSGAASVTCSSSNGTAIAGSDYTTISSVLSWANGNSANKSCTVPIINDTTAESTETFNVALSNASGAALGAPSTATVSIVDNDSPSVPGNLRTSPSGVIQGRSFSVLWNTSSGNPSTYKLDESTNYGSTWPSTYTINAPSLSYAFTKPNADATYSYRIRACNAAGQCSANSSVVQVTTILMCGEFPC